ncbi:MAG: 30S ribosomal protein S6 [Candidatus Manganitrophaceae bacterium]
MNGYETIFIVKPTLSEEEVAKIMEKVNGAIQKAGGEVVMMENWGKRKLAYEVQKEKKGNYIISHFKGGGQTVSEVERTYRLDESIIKFMTVTISPENLGKALPVKDEKPVFHREREGRWGGEKKFT